MNRCKDCKRWDPADRKLGDGYGLCGAVPYPEWAGDDAILPNPKPLATVIDAERYAAWLYTLPDFGCVLWEAKEK